MNPPALYAVSHAHESLADTAKRLAASAKDAEHAMFIDLIAGCDELRIKFAEAAAAATHYPGAGDLAERFAGALNHQRNSLETILKRNTR